MDISPVAATQVLQGRDGRRYEVNGAAADVVRELQLLDDTLGASYNEAGYFVVWQALGPDGIPVKGGERREVVVRVPMEQWDRRVIDYVGTRAYELRHGRSAATRLEQEAAKRKADEQYALDQAVGEQSHRMLHALRKDLGDKRRAFFPAKAAA